LYSVLFYITLYLAIEIGLGMNEGKQLVKKNDDRSSCVVVKMTYRIFSLVREEN